MKAGWKGPDGELAAAPLRPRRGPALHVGVLLLGLLFLSPVAYLVWGTLGLGGEFWGALTRLDTLRPLRNSLLIATGTALSCMLLGTTLAWLVTRTDLPGRRFWRMVLPLPLVIPSFVGATALLSALGPGGLVPFAPRIEGFWGAFLVLTLLGYPFVYLPVTARLTTTAPSLEEAARLLGDRPVRTVRKVVLPEIRDAVAAGAMLVFLYGLSDFGAVALMRYDTITRAIFLIAPLRPGRPRSPSDSYWPSWPSPWSWSREPAYRAGR